MDAGEKQKKTFIRFLKENNCYQQYVKNNKQYMKQNKSLFKSFDEIIQYSGEVTNNPELLYSFCWNDTKEGDNYWLKIHVKWKKFNVYFKG